MPRYISGLRKEDDDEFTISFKYFKSDYDPVYILNWIKNIPKPEVMVMKKVQFSGFKDEGIGDGDGPDGNPADKLTPDLNFTRDEPSCGLIPPSQWKIHRFDFPQGLILIKNPFTAAGQRYWISRCVWDYPYAPSINNISKLAKSNLSKDEIDSTRLPQSSDADFYEKLRWATFGYHHNWDTKVYSEDSKCDFPKDLSLLTNYVAGILGFEDFDAQAAICNYYNLESMISGHQDKSEVNLEAPLFSISFGQSAIFLIGGDSKDIEPIPMHLDSGDVVVMSGESRLSYHGVPKIFETKDTPWNEDFEKRDQEIAEFAQDPAFSGAKDVVDKWNQFMENYIQSWRINLNIRQVLHPGHSELIHGALMIDWLFL